MLTDIAIKHEGLSKIDRSWREVVNKSENTTEI